MVELLSTNPAKLFGLYPRKGTIAVGSDADIVVFDPERKVTISASTHHSKSDYNLFEGTEVTGVPEVVLLRGQVLVEDGELVASPGIGQFVRASEVRRRAEARDRSRLGSLGRDTPHGTRHKDADRSADSHEQRQGVRGDAGSTGVTASRDHRGVLAVLPGELTSTARPNLPHSQSLGRETP